MTNTLPQNRISSIDLLKGLVMVVMALDHVRDFFHYSTFFFNPMDPSQTTVPIFFTRFITHFCAPAFSFLAGLSAFMSGRKKSKGALSAFLLKRGLWLLLLEFTLVVFGWAFDPTFSMNNIAVIACLGMSMMLLAALIHLPRTVLLVLCCVVIVGHNLLDPINLPENFFWSVIHQQSIFQFGNVKFYVDYPIIPWFAVMALGYCFGPLYNKETDARKRRQLLTMTGIAAVCLFVLLRWLNIYGDLLPWTEQSTAVRTLFSFLNVTKYPPSLLYLLLTLGCTMIFLGISENFKGRIVNFFTTFGRVPFFYYLLHLYLMHVLAVIYGLVSGHGWKLLSLPDWLPEIHSIRGYGTNLVGVYLVWILVIAIAYPICKWYDCYKTVHKEKWWLSYL
ncbi:MAG: heparan-alpha-glucosaminide N-acetyltransferase domain-containing protein [Chitinophagaceae bacterium]